jgi:hypothetical protein
VRLPPAGAGPDTGSVPSIKRGTLPRTLEEIREEHADSPVLRGLVRVLNDKLQLRSRYAFLDYEAAMEGHSQCSELYRTISRIEADQIARLSAVLVTELQSANRTINNHKE